MILCPQIHKLNETNMRKSLWNKSDCMSALMQTLKVRLINNDKSMMIRLFDSGSQKSSLREKCV